MKLLIDERKFKKACFFYFKNHFLILFNYIFSTRKFRCFFKKSLQIFIDLKSSEISEESKLKNNFNKEKNEINPNNESQMVQLKT